MSDSELLNRQLTAMENGASQEQSPDQLPAGHREQRPVLRPLLNLVDQIRTLDHPELSPDTVVSHQRQLVEATRSLDRPLRLPEPSPDRRRWQTPARVATIGFVFLVALFAVALVAGSMWLGESRRLHQVTVEGTTGSVEVAEDGAWKPVEKGDRLTAGKRIRTGPDSSLTLAYFEGTRTTLGSDTDVTLTTVEGTTGALRVLLSQHTGSTSHTVVPLRGEDGFFIVDTPNGRATVQGTVFDVLVSEKGQALFNVDEGRVKITGAGQEVLLLAGQSTSAAAGKAPEPVNTEECTYGKGYWKNHPDDWPVTRLTLGGVISDQVELLDVLGTPPRGDATYILAGQLIAAKLNVSAGADPSDLGDTITDADAWLVINPLGSDPTGEERQVGIGLAETLDEYNSGTIGPGSCDDEQPPATTAITPTVTMTPTTTISATLVVTDCTGANPHPHATTLEDQLGVPYDEIMGWKCSGFGFGEIKHAYTLSQTGFTAADIFEMRHSGLGWGQIRKLLLDGDPEENGRSGGNPNKGGQDNPHGKKDKADLGHGNNGHGNGNGYSAGVDGANNGGGGNGKTDLGHGNGNGYGQVHPGRVHPGRGHGGQGNNGKTDLGHGNGNGGGGKKSK